MTKSNYVLVVFVVDESGSMSICRDKVIEGFNEFLSEQRKDKNGDVDVSLYKFSTDGLNNCVYKMKNIKEVNDISEKDYNPSGLTALNDAVCTAIDETGKILAEKKEDERPSKVIFVIMTDGHENCSVEFGANDIKEKIKHQEEKYSWNFVYLGYNLSDAEDAKLMGFKNIAFNTYEKADSSYKTLSKVASAYRCCATANYNTCDSLLESELHAMNTEYEKETKTKIKNL